MQYMMFVATDPEPDPEPSDDDVDVWVDEMDARGVRVFGERLRPVEDATTVRVRRGELLVTDGPFTESKEWIAGFDVLECRDLDEAIEIASKHPMARSGRLELRPFWPIDATENPVPRADRNEDGADKRGRRTEPALGS